MMDFREKEHFVEQVWQLRNENAAFKIENEKLKKSIVAMKKTSDFFCRQHEQKIILRNKQLDAHNEQWEKLKAYFFVDKCDMKNWRKMVELEKESDEDEC